ncbi:MAG TPA: VOC family protein [Mycobacterium sp.]|nr:VOC family protein [Mycobacterium sp.]
MDRQQAPLANVIELGVRDLAAQRDFYRGLGWPQLESDVFTVFELRGAVLALFPIERLAEESHVPPDFGEGGIRFRIAVIAERPEDVDDIARRVRAAGGTVTREPADADFFEGRSMYFSDPEGHCWEVAWTPPHNPIVAAARRAARR